MTPGAAILDLSGIAPAVVMSSMSVSPGVATVAGQTAVARISIFDIIQFKDHRISDPSVGGELIGVAYIASPGLVPVHITDAAIDPAEATAQRIETTTITASLEVD